MALKEYKEKEEVGVVLKEDKEKEELGGGEGGHARRGRRVKWWW